MPDPTPLAALAMRARKGDRKAFEEIVRATARLVYARIVAIVRDRQKAEDLTQETFVAAWKGINGTRSVNKVGSQRDNGTPGMHEGDAKRDNGEGSLIAWLLTVARNTTLDALKAETRQKRGGGQATMADTGDIADQAGSPAQSAERAEAISHAISVLEELPEEYRQVLSMRYLAGADYESIRRTLDLTDGSLRGLLSRGMALMRERMGRTNDKVTR